MAARAVDIASLCHIVWVGWSIETGIGWLYTPLRENPSPQAPCQEVKMSKAAVNGSRGRLRNNEHLSHLSFYS